MILSEAKNLLKETSREELAEMPLDRETYIFFLGFLVRAMMNIDKRNAAFPNGAHSLLNGLPKISRYTKYLLDKYKRVNQYIDAVNPSPGGVLVNKSFQYIMYHDDEFIAEYGDNLTQKDLCNIAAALNTDL